MLSRFKYLLLIVVAVSFGCTDEEYLREISRYQFELNKEFANPQESPLLPEDLKDFVKLPFFKVDKDYRIVADFERTPNEREFEMPTTTDRKPIYKKYGIARFEMEGEEHSLEIYQNQDLIKKSGYHNHLFLPYGDATNGDESYGGGRFIDLEIPEGNTIIIDFNKSYNPLCAYNHKYSCPIPPKANQLSVAIRAGVKAPAPH